MKKEGKVWIKISGDFATFLKFRSWKRSNIKSKHITSGQIRSNTSKHIPKGEKQLNTKIWKRMMAGLLAGVLIFTGIPFSASAGEPPVQMIIRGDAFQNRQINIFGHSHRSITCYYVNPVDMYRHFACSRERNFPITPRHPGRGTVRHRKPPYRS
mgnify:CR=1 FL=1